MIQKATICMIIRESKQKILKIRAIRHLKLFVNDVQFHGSRPQ